MAWTALTFAFGSILTSSKMTQLYDNITAVTQGDSGAPTNDISSFTDVQSVHQCVHNFYHDTHTGYIVMAGTSYRDCAQLRLAVPEHATSLKYEARICGNSSGETGYFRINGTNTGTGLSQAGTTPVWKTGGSLTLDAAEKNATVTFQSQAGGSGSALDEGRLYEFTCWFE